MLILYKFIVLNGKRKIPPLKKKIMFEKDNYITYM